MHGACKNCSNKEATLHPTNPRDRVVDWTGDVVRNLRDLLGRGTATPPEQVIALQVLVKLEGLRSRLSCLPRPCRPLTTDL
jgi:hypothetical protein